MSTPSQNNESPAVPPENASEVKAETPRVKKSSQGAVTVWAGADIPRLAKLAALKPPLSFSRIGRAITLPVMAVYNEFWKWAEFATHGRKVRDVEVNPEPIFVVGHWRSGTTLLHNLLCQDKQFGFPNLYQCLFPHHFLLTEAVNVPLTGWALPNSRPMDNVPCGWELPQEDEIAICLLSMLSPYRMAAFMEDRHKYESYLDPVDMRPEERRELRETIRYFMKKLSVRHRDESGKPKALCMKSPPHTFRVAELIDMYPKARFLYIHRNPYDVFNSTVHLRQTMWENNSLCVADIPNSEDIALDILCNAIKAYERDKSLVPAGQLVEMRFEDLAADPLSMLGDAYSTLGLGGFEALAETIRPQLPEMKSYKRNKFVMDEAKKRFVYDRAKFIFDLYGYEHGLDDAAVA